MNITLTLGRVLLNNYTHLYAKPLELYSIEPRVNDTAEWTRHVVGLPAGEYRAIFAFRMGYSFECGAALDDVIAGPCTQNDLLIKWEDISGRIQTCGAHC